SLQPRGTPETPGGRCSAALAGERGERVIEIVACLRLRPAGTGPSNPGRFAKRNPPGGRCSAALAAERGCVIGRIRLLAVKTGGSRSLHFGMSVGNLSALKALPQAVQVFRPGAK